MPGGSSQPSIQDFTEPRAEGLPSGYNRGLRQLISLGRLLAVQDWLFLAIIAAAVYVRFWIAFTQPMFVDEGAISPESALMIHALYAGNWRSPVFGLDSINPEFTKLFYGFWMSVPYGFHAPPVTYAPGSETVPFQAIVAARLSADCLNLTVLGWLYTRLRVHGRWFGLASIGALALNPAILFYTSLGLIESLLVPFSVLYIWFLSESRFQVNRYLGLAAVCYGLCVSVQYTAALFILVPIGFCIIYTLGQGRRKLEITALNLLQVCFYLAALGAVVFVCLNPYYWADPLTRALAVFQTGGRPLGLPSGVHNVPVVFDGRVSLTTPFWVPLINVVIVTPLLVFCLSCLGAYFLLASDRVRAARAGVIGILGLSTLGVLLPSEALIQHLHTIEAYTYTFVPLSFLFGLGFSGLVARINRLWNVRRTLPEFSQSKRLVVHRTRSFATLRDAVPGGLLVAYLVAVGVALGPVGFAYTNELSSTVVSTGSGYAGAWGSPTADHEIATYMASHGLTNTSVLSLALTASLRYYEPAENYVQLWSTINATELVRNYSGYYLVVDEWYSQLFGNPVPPGTPGISVIVRVSVPYGVSTLYHIGSGTPPHVDSFTVPQAGSNQTIQIQGGGFGNTPSLEPVGVGPFFDTELAAGAPAISITDYAPGGRAEWSGGLGNDAVGIRILSWSNTKIVIGGFSPNVGPGLDFPNTYPMNPGDQVSFTVYGPNQSGSAYFLATVGPAVPYAPEITSVSVIYASAAQQILIRGTGFGEAPVLAPARYPDYSTTLYSSTSPSLSFSDLTPHGAFSLGAGFEADAVGIRLGVWTPTSITILGFTPNAGPYLDFPDQYDLNPGDQYELSVYGPNSSGCAYYVSHVSSNISLHPSITSVTSVSATSNQTIVLNGSGFGTAPSAVLAPFAPYVDTQFSIVTPSMSITDYSPNGSARWSGGYLSDAVGVLIRQWTNTRIIIGGFSPNLGAQSVGNGTYRVEEGDDVQITVYGPNGTGAGDAGAVVGLFSGYAPNISQVSSINSSGNQTVVIDGTGLGSSPELAPIGLSGFVDSEYNLTAPSISIQDLSHHSHAPWAAAFNSDRPGVVIVSWSPTQVVLGGFGPGVGSTNTSAFELLAGDTILITIFGPNLGGPAYWLATVT